MHTAFGPWATTMHTSPNVQLSTFWKRRLTKLPDVGRCRSRVGRSTALVLLCSALLVCAMPTLRPMILQAEPIQPNALAAKAVKQSEEAEERTVRGTVTDEAGRPISGADVWLPLNREEQPEKRRSLHRKTDGQGRFELTLPEGWARGWWTQTAPMMLWAYAPGREIGVANAFSALFVDPAEAEEVVVQLAEASDMSFRILDPEGRPLQGVRVESSSFPISNDRGTLPPELEPHVSGVSDAAGRVRLPSLPETATERLLVTSNAFGVQIVKPSLEIRVNELTIRLRPAGRVEGRIVAQRPEWARGVRIRLTTLPEKADDPNAPQGTAQLVSDDEGRFTVPAIAAGSMKVYAYVPAYLPVRPRVPYPMEVAAEADGATTLEIPLERAVRIRGVVRVKGTNEPVSRARIAVQYGDLYQTDDPPFRVTDQQGRFEAWILSGSIRTHLSGLPEQFVHVGPVERDQHEIPAGMEEFELPPIEVVPARSQRGRILDEHDRPVANVKISARAPARTWTSASYGESNERGEFTLKRLPPQDVELLYLIAVNGQQAARARVEQADPLLLRVRSEAIAVAKIPRKPPADLYLEADFFQTPLRDSLQYLEDLSRVKLIISDEARAQGFPFDAPISLEQAGPLGAVLDAMLKPLNFSYEVRGGAIVILPKSGD
jgi:hypothetical protein